MKNAAAGLILAVALGVSQSASATVLQLAASLDCGQEVGPTCDTSPAGTGSASITLDDVTNELTWNISWSNLTGDATAMHFHNAPAGLNGGVEITLDHTSSPDVDSQFISAAQAAEVLAGEWYINIHTVREPGGEIRGQVLRVPEPAGLLWMAGLLALGFLPRR